MTSRQNAFSLKEFPLPLLAFRELNASLLTKGIALSFVMELQRETETGEEAKRCAFLWKIENISHCWLKMGEGVGTPTFIADVLEGTKWSLHFYPLGFSDGSDHHVIFYLRRENDCNGPDFVQVNYQLALICKDGSYLNILNEPMRIFLKGTWSVAGYKSRKTLFVTERESFISKDTLTVVCVIWNTDEGPVKYRSLSVETVFNVNRRSFVWRIHGFSTAKPGLRIKFRDGYIDFDLVLNEGLDLEKKLVINGILLDKTIKYFSFKICIIDFEKKKEDCGTHEYFADDLSRGISSTVLFAKTLMENKSRYLPNDTLSLNCEYFYSDGTVLYELYGDGTINPKVMNVAIQKEKHREVKQNPQPIPFLAIDMKSMLNEGIFSDMELRTSTQTFPVHKNILSARSPVFRRMFSNDMKEKNSGHVDITDLEDDTVSRMIRYIYTDSLEVLQLEDACKLYVAADKYEILSLKSRCSTYLKDNLCPNKAIDILVVADLHHDDDLKSAVQDYMWTYDTEVFGSEKWKYIMDTDPKLAADTIYRKFFPG